MIAKIKKIKQLNIIDHYQDIMITSNSIFVAAKVNKWDFTIN
jgi:hypothetical protein